MRNMREWNSLIEEVKDLPAPVAAALATGRHEFLAMYGQTGMTAEEAKPIMHLVKVLLLTNRELQEHSARVYEQTRQAGYALKGLQTHVERLESLAAFREPSEEES